MTVMYSTSMSVQPGRFPEALDLATKAVKVLGARGLTTRFYRVLAGGAFTDHLRSTTEMEDLDAWARFMEQSFTDAEVQDLLADISSATSPIVMLHQSLGTEIAGTPPVDSPAGGVVTVVAQRIKPGRTEDAIAFLEETNPVLLRCGARRNRAYQLLLAGTETMLVANITEFASYGDWARVTTAMRTDPEFARVMARLASADSPVEMVSLDLEVELPLG